jgi:hypothetical protein
MEWDSPLRQNDTLPSVTGLKKFGVNGEAGMIQFRRNQRKMKIRRFLYKVKDKRAE